VRVNVNVEPTGTELDSKTKLKLVGDKEEAVEDETETLRGIKEADAKSKELSSTDHIADASSVPAPAKATEAVRKSLLDGSIFTLLTFETMEAIFGREGLIIFNVTSNWLDLIRKVS
jgi:hypothetical protein